MANETILNTVLDAISRFPVPLKLMMLATNQAQKHTELAQSKGVSLLFEAFADRRYTDAGTLTPRSQAGSVLNKKQMLAQVEQLVNEGTVTTDTNKVIALRADTLCVHGDNLEGIAAIKEIRALCQR